MRWLVLAILLAGCTGLDSDERPAMPPDNAPESAPPGMEPGPSASDAPVPAPLSSLGVVATPEGTELHRIPDAATPGMLESLGQPVRWVLADGQVLEGTLVSYHVVADGDSVIETWLVR